MNDLLDRKYDGKQRYLNNPRIRMIQINQLILNIQINQTDLNIQINQMILSILIIVEEIMRIPLIQEKAQEEVLNKVLITMKLKKIIII